MKFLALLLLAIPAYAQGPTVFQGNLGTAVCGRPDATLCVQAPTSPSDDQAHANITIDLSLYPCNPLAEGMLNFQGRDFIGNQMQMGSLSILPTGGCGPGGYTVLRLNSTRGSQGADVAYRQWGGRGIGLFRQGDNDHCGGRFLCITRTFGLPSIAGTAEAGVVINGTPSGDGSVFINSYGKGTTHLSHGGGDIQIGTPVSNVCPNGWKECLRMLDSTNSTFYVQVAR